MRLVITLVAALALLVATARPPQPAPRRDGVPVLPRASLLRGVFAGQLHLIADYFWLLTINRVGAAQTPTEHGDTYWYADLVTDLDPAFKYVYSFVAITLPVRLPDGTHANVREAERLLEKGLEHHPGDQKLLFQLASNLMFYEGKYTRAADIFTELSRRPGAPYWYSQLATRLYAAGGELDTSEYLTRSLLESCSDPESCEFYERRLIELQQERLLLEIDDAIRRFEENQHRAPRDVAELVENRLLPGWPQDPLGGDIYIAQDGRAHSTSIKHRLELIREDAPVAAPPSDPTTP